MLGILIDKDFMKLPLGKCAIGSILSVGISGGFVFVVYPAKYLSAMNPIPWYEPKDANSKLISSGMSNIPGRHQG